MESRRDTRKAGGVPPHPKNAEAARGGDHRAARDATKLPDYYTTTCIQALEYIGRGWSPLPIPDRSKAPVLEGWPKLIITAETAGQYFNGERQNIGVLLGEPSGSLVDVDIDCPEAGVAARYLLWDTGSIFGRASNPSSHHLFVARCISKKFSEPGKDGATLIELRSTGAQTVFPRSTHETGEPIEWEVDNGPAEVEGKRLERLVGLTAAAALVARHWPASSRHDTSLALAGALKHSSWSIEQTTLFVRAVAEAASDEQVQDRERAVVDTYAKATPTTSWPRLGELLGADVVGRLTDWLGIEKPSGLSGGEEWPEPVPLPSGLPAVEPFEPKLLPEAFRPWIEDISDRIQCAPDFPATGAMVGLASVVGRKVGIKPKSRDDWSVVPNLWGAPIGRPGILKTPPLVEVKRPLDRLEIAAKKGHEGAVKSWQANEIIAKERAKVTAEEIRRRLKNGGDVDHLARNVIGSDEPEPQRRRYVVNDTTVEKMGEILRANPNGVLIFRDELTGFLRSLEREGQEAGRAFYLEAWNGTGRFTYDRIGRGTVDIEACCVSILGGIQPGPLSDYLRGVTRGGAADDGLIQRFQLLVWPEPNGKWRNVDRWPNREAKERAYEVFTRLDSLDIAGERDDDSGIPFLRFEPEAQGLFVEWRGELEARLRSGELPEALESHLAKYRSLIPSLALLIHLADMGSGPVSLLALQRACGWGDYLESHAKRVYSPVITSDIPAAKALLSKLLAGELSERFTLRDVYRPQWSALAQPDDAKHAVELLLEFDWLRAEDERTGGRPRTWYRLNPRARS